MNRVALPSNESLGLPSVALLQDPAPYNVQVPLVGPSDDELRTKVETDNDWGLYDTHEIDSPSLSLTALHNRFSEVYQGDRIDKPGAFIDAVLTMQRTLPNAREYAAVLARQGLIRPQEAQIVPQSAYDLDIQTDDGSEAARAYYKLYYLANVTESNAEAAEAASRFASDSMQLQGKYSQKLADRRRQQLLEARGVDPATVEAALVGELGISGSSQQLSHLAELGLTRPQLEDLASAPFDPRLLQRYKSAPHLAEHVLGDGTLDRQIAIRQFFGTDNLTNLLIEQVRLEKSIDDNDAGFSPYFIGVSMARSLMGSPKTEGMTIEDFTSNFNAYFQTAVPVRANLPELGGLAVFATREKAIVGNTPRSDVLSHHVSDMVMSDYRWYLDLKLADEKRSAV